MKDDKPYVPPVEPWKKDKKPYRRLKSPDVLRAKGRINGMISSGRVRRKPCQLELTGCNRFPVEAHHRSYRPGRELDVIWACHRCHKRIGDGTTGIKRDAVIHIYGPQCGGKSRAISKAGLSDRTWDAAEYYVSVGALTPEDLKSCLPSDMRLRTPDEWRARTETLTRDLYDHLESGTGVYCIESSGLSRKITAVIDAVRKAGKYLFYIPVYPESDDILAKMAEKRGMDSGLVVDAAERWKAAIGANGKSDRFYTSDEAAVVLEQLKHLF